MGPDMPPLPSRTPRTRPAAARSLAPARRLASAPARRPSPAPARLPSVTPVAPPIKILLAGIDKDDRRAVEATIRHALGAHAASGAWSISVVSFGNQWSVTLDGPGDRLRGVSFVTEPGQLRDAIRKAIGGGWEALAPGSPPDSTLPLATDARDTHVCEYCQADRGGGVRASIGRTEDPGPSRLPALLEGGPRRDRRLGGRRRRLPLREGLGPGQACSPGRARQDRHPPRANRPKGLPADSS